MISCRILLKLSIYDSGGFEKFGYMKTKSFDTLS